MKTDNQIWTIKILIVGGQSEQWQTYENTFKEIVPNWEVTINGCTQVEEALETLQTNSLTFNIILVEDELPGMRGLDFCKELRAREVPLPKLLMLEKENEHLEMEALESGVNDCIIKDQKKDYLHRLPLVVRRVTLNFHNCIVRKHAEAALRETREKFLKKQEELLKSKNLESIGILAGGIARDFNNYLTSIMGNISIAKMSLHNTRKIHRSLNRAEEISIKAADLAAKLLTFSEGGEPVNRKNSIIDIIRNTIKYHFKNTPVTFHYSSEKKIWPVCGDESQLTQVIYNILLNAVQAIPVEGEVIIETENVSLAHLNEFSLTAGNYVKIYVKDTGVGIPAKNLDKIFDPFFSTKEAITHEGVGMGLSISQSIIKKHSGTITVDSTEGKGTTVTIVIPAYREEPCQPFYEPILLSFGPLNDRINPFL
jgi:signal transduction histidine kinase